MPVLISNYLNRGPLNSTITINSPGLNPVTQSQFRPLASTNSLLPSFSLSLSLSLTLSPTLALTRQLLSSTWPSSSPLVGLSTGGVLWWEVCVPPVGLCDPSQLVNENAWSNFTSHLWNVIKHAKHSCIFLLKNENISILRANLLTLNNVFRKNIL